MGDSAEFEKLTMLEARLAAALDRIAGGLASGATPPQVLEDPGITSAAFEDAQARADTAETTAAQWAERADMLEAQLAETQAALAAATADGDGDDDAGEGRDDTDAALAALTQERDALAGRIQALEAAREADQDEANRALAARDDEIASLRADLETARAAADDTTTGEDDDSAAGGGAAQSHDDVHVLQMRLKRLKRQRAMARGERDRALDTIDELDRSPEDIDARILQLRRELSDLRVTNADLIEQLSAMNSETLAALPKATVVEALVTELHALQEVRAAEAAELDRIVADLGPLEAEDKAHA